MSRLRAAGAAPLPAAGVASNSSGGSGLGITHNCLRPGTWRANGSTVASACTVTMSARGYRTRRSTRHMRPMLVSTTGLVRSHTISGVFRPRVARMAATLTLVRKDTTTSGARSHHGAQRPQALPCRHDAARAGAGPIGQPQQFDIVGQRIKTSALGRVGGHQRDLVATRGPAIGKRGGDPFGAAGVHGTDQQQYLHRRPASSPAPAR